MKKVSICIPAYEMKERGAEFITDNINSIIKQTYSNYEIIVSDHSRTDDVKNAVEKFHNQKIKYVRYEENRGNIGCNINNAVTHATGDVIKFLLQDDYYYYKESLEFELYNLKDADWALAPTIHEKDSELFNIMIPQYTHDTYLGRNSIGSPSVVICKKESFIPFDEKLTMIVDCDFYRMMYDTYGYPNITEKVTTVSRVWDGQHQKNMDYSDVQREVEYINIKYSGLSIEKTSK